MKRIALLLAGSFLLIANVSFSQAVNDRAVIPVAVTLNSILRLNVTSGGNIEFNFNTLADYQNGIANTAAHTTKFNVASSVDWEVNMYAEDDNLIGTDRADGLTTLPLGIIGYQVTKDGTGEDTRYDIPAAGVTVNLNFNENEILVSKGTGSNAGDIAQNAFSIEWRCGTGDVMAALAVGNILELGAAADRYATNVFLVLQPF